MTRLAWTMNRYVAFLTRGSCPLSAPGQRCWRGFPLGSSRRWGRQGFWGAQLEELAQYECWKKGMMPYWVIMAIATPLGLLRWVVILSNSIVHPRDTMLMRRTMIRITFRAVSVACCPNAKGGATLVREVLLCLQPGLWSSGLAKAPLVLFILLRD